MTSIEVRQASAVLYTDISMRVKSERVAHSESEREKQRARERERREGGRGLGGREKERRAIMNARTLDHRSAPLCSGGEPDQKHQQAQARVRSLLRALARSFIRSHEPRATLERRKKKCSTMHGQ